MSYPEYGTSMIKCGKRTCTWTGTERDLKQVPYKKFATVTQAVCPKCGCDSYYFVEKKAEK